MRPMPSSVVLIGSGSARERTAKPRSARSWMRLRTSRMLRPSAASPAVPGTFHQLLRSSPAAVVIRCRASSPVTASASSMSKMR